MGTAFQCLYQGVASSLNLYGNDVAAGPSAAMDVEEIVTPEPSKITVTIVGATGLRASDWAPGPERPYCICTISIGETELYCTEAIERALEPRWQERTTIIGRDVESDLRFDVWDVEKWSVRPDERGSKEVLMSTTLPAGKYNECGFTGDLPLEQEGEGPSLRVKVKLRDEDYPEPPPVEFPINVAREKEDKVGLDLHLGDDVTLRVTGVQEGPFLDSALRPGDFIVSVNGLRGNPTEMKDKMKAATKLEVRVHKPVEFTTCLDARETGHGLHLATTRVHNCLLVNEVRKGAFLHWNENNPKQVKVRSKDRLVAINGQRGEAGDLNEELSKVVKDKGIAQVTFVRPADPELTPWVY